MKQLVKSGNLPLSQAMNRVAERSKFYPLIIENTKSNFRLIHPKKCNQLPEGYSSPHKSIEFSNFSVCDKPPENCCYLKDESIIFIESICYYKERAVIFGHKILNLVEIEDYPCDSRLLGICKAHQFSERQVWPVSEIEKKGIAVCLNDECFIFPILHSDTKL